MYTYNGIYGGPHSREIGRMFMNKGIAAQVILNQVYDLKKQRLTTPLIVKLYREEGRLRVLNIGCGGCGDIPLFEAEANRVLKSYGIASPNIWIENVDNDSDLIERVKKGTLTYFRIFDLININSREGLNGRETVRKITDYIASHFNETGSKEKVSISGIVGMMEGEIHAYLMNPSVSAGIRIQTGDAKNLPYSDGYFDLILAHNFFNQQGFNKNEKNQYIQQMVRVLRKKGILFPNYGLYKKNNGTLEKLTRFYSPKFSSLKEMRLSGGILPLEIPNDAESVFSLEHYEKGADMDYYSVNFDNLLSSVIRLR